MALPLPPHPDLPAWAERHGLDASRVVAPLDVRPAPTREHPHQVRVDYVVLLTDSSGRVHRDARTMLTCDPPPPHGHRAEPTQDDRDVAERLRALVDSGRRFGVAAFTYEQLVATLVGPATDGAVPVGYVNAYTDADFDAAWQACAKVRDAAPRLATDADSSDVVRAVLDAVAPAIAARARQDALREAITAHRDLHRIYGSTATCGGGIGGAMMTAHCGVVCNRGNHQAENDAWEAVERSYFDGETVTP